MVVQLSAPIMNFSILALDILNRVFDGYGVFELGTFNFFAPPGLTAENLSRTHGCAKILLPSDPAMPHCRGRMERAQTAWGTGLRAKKYAANSSTNFHRVRVRQDAL